MKKGLKRAIVIGIGLIVLGGGGYAVYSFMSARQMATQAALSSHVETAIPVQVESPTQGDLAVTTEFIGRTQPGEVVNVLPKMGGTVLHTYFEVGESVKKGDLLFDLDPSDLATVQAQVSAAQAGLEVAKVNVDRSLGSQLELQLAQTDTALRNAQNSYNNAKRSFEDYEEDFDPSVEKLEDTMDEMFDSLKQTEKMKSMADENLKAAQKAYDEMQIVGSPSEGMDPGYLYESLIAAQAAYSKAASAYSTLQSSYQQLRDAVTQKRDGYDVQMEQLRAQMKAADIAMDSATQTKDITTKKAVPETEAAAQAQLAQAQASYVATAKQYEVQLSNTRVTSPIDGVIELKNVDQHGQASPQAPAYVVSNKNTMIIKFAIPATAARKMTVGDSLQIENGSTLYDGAVIEIGTMVEEQSGLFPIKARVDAPDGALLTGVAVKVIATTDQTESALLIPINSIYHDKDGSYVYTMSADGTAVKTSVETGLTDDTLIEILSGLDAQSSVITSWNPNLLGGAKVAVPGAETIGASSVATLGDSTQASSVATSGQEG